MDSPACLIAELTPPGRGAVAVVTVQGPTARQLVDRCFHAASGRPLTDYNLSRIAFGHWQSEHGDGEELVVCVRSQDCVEVHCHGGMAAVNRITADLQQTGARLVPWHELPADHSLLGSQTQERIATEALLAVAQTRTTRMAGILLDQLRGALSRTLGDIQQLLVDGQQSLAQTRLQQLTEVIPAGRHAIAPSRIVLVGRPNVGKSSLMNALAGFERAVVSPIAGTTRDVVTTSLAIAGWPVEILDTAGQHADVVDEIERLGIELAREQSRSASLILLVVDATRMWQPADQQLLDELTTINVPLIIVHNKTDLAEPTSDGRSAGHHISALSGLGLNELQRAITKKLVPIVPAPGAAVPFTERQIECLLAASVSVQQHDLQQAIEHVRRCRGGPS